MHTSTKKVETEYEVTQKRLGVDGAEKCDRCGNDLRNGVYYLHLPFRKQYIKICGVCQHGLMYGFYLDVVRKILEK